MPQLNTTFNRMSNDSFNLMPPRLPKLGVMQKIRHESMQRLMQAAQNHGIETPSGLAMALEESEQVITNWGRRGVSRQGALKAADKFGCSPNWILTGAENTPTGYSTEALALAWLLDQIPDRIARTRANNAATKAVLDVIHESAAPPTHTLTRRVNQEKRHA